MSDTKELRLKKYIYTYTHTHTHIFTKMHIMNAKTRHCWQWLSWLPPGNKTGGWKTQGGRDTYLSCLPFYNFKTLLYVHVVPIKIFPSASVVKNLPAKQKTWVQSLGQKDPLEKGNSNLLQYSCLGGPMDRGAWWATVHRVSKELDTV